VKKYLIPLAVFVSLGLLLGYGLSLDPRKIPSPLIGKTLPSYTLPTVADPSRRVNLDDLRGRVYLLNVWASWCVACRQEHPLLNELARRQTVPLIGLNYKDERADALNWLANLGNPYEMSLSDLDGRLGIELGVYGVPETFLIDEQGTIRYKHIGPLSPDDIDKILLVKLAELRRPANPSADANIKLR
jgi:cytochrome c biogenesis protein CcmG, thiol:disulfide interchange protein DsbE